MSYKKVDPRIPLRYHITFWVVYFIINFIRYGSMNNDYWYSFKSNLIEFPLNIAITYFTIYFLIPKFILTKKYFLFALYFILSLTVFYLIRTGLTLYLVSENIWPEAEGSDKAFSFNHIIAMIIGIIYVIGFVAAIKLTNDWIYEKRRNDELKKLQLQTELNYLRTQIQPHFFFNTLNNLYALTLEKSDYAPEVVLKLSEIMEYVLYDMKGKMVSLIKEIKYLQSFLDLEKLRYGNKFESHIDIRGNISDVKVPPLIFITFIENCFKHGMGENDDSKININISFELNGYFLYFTVSNTYISSAENTGKEGIGIKNIKRRLDLLYGKNYNLNIFTKDDQFIVELKIPVE